MLFLNLSKLYRTPSGLDCNYGRIKSKLKSKRNEKTRVSFAFESVRIFTLLLNGQIETGVKGFYLT